jgi:short-subunit dehydrogenase
MSLTMRVRGSVAVVTGASRGIGREIALALGRAGASVALVARDRAALEGVAGQIGPERALVFPADLAELGELPGVVRAAEGRFGRVDILVNNAGIASSHDFLETSPEFVARTVDINFRAAAVLTRLAVEGMSARRRGHIVNVASLAGVLGIPGEPTYSGTKAALRLFTSSLRLELGEHGVYLTDVVLGTVPTDMLGQVEDSPRVRRYFDRGRRLGLLVDTPPREVAGAVVRAIERRGEVVVLPTRAWFMHLPLQGVARAVGRLLAR